MGTMVLRPHDCFQNRLPTDASQSFPPSDSHRDTRRRPHKGPPPRHTKLFAKSDAFPGRRPPPFQAKPSGSRNNRGCCAARVRPGRRRRTPDHHRQMVVKPPVKELVMEEVTILKRGQGVAAEDPRPLDLVGNAAEDRQPSDLELCTTGRLGPDPEILSKQIRLMDQKPHFYAGSGFFASPPPSSLPLPTSFFSKKDVADTVDLATRALRGLCLDLP